MDADDADDEITEYCHADNGRNSAGLMVVCCLVDGHTGDHDFQRGCAPALSKTAIDAITSDALGSISAKPQI